MFFFNLLFHVTFQSNPFELRSQGKYHSKISITLPLQFIESFGLFPNYFQKSPLA